MSNDYVHLEMLRNSQLRVIDISYFPDFTGFFVSMLIDLISGGGKNRPRPLNVGQSEAVTVSPPPLPTGILFSSQFRSHQETKMAAHPTDYRHL